MEFLWNIVLQYCNKFCTTEIKKCSGPSGQWLKVFIANKNSMPPCHQECNFFYGWYLIGLSRLCSTVHLLFFWAIPTKLSFYIPKGDLFPQNYYDQMLTFNCSSFCTESKWNLVAYKLNNTPSWIPNFIDFLYKMAEWQAI